MINICCVCHQVTSIDLLLALDNYPHNQSHGTCVDCMPGWLEENGMSKDEVKNFMKEWEGKHGKET